MASFHESMDEYRKQLEKGAIQKAYKGLMETIMDLRTHLKNHIESATLKFIQDVESFLSAHKN